MGASETIRNPIPNWNAAPAPLGGRAQQQRLDGSDFAAIDDEQLQIKHRQLTNKEFGGRASLPCPTLPRHRGRWPKRRRERTSATAKTRAYAAVREKKDACC
jgi:hypothetical protein